MLWCENNVIMLKRNDFVSFRFLILFLFLEKVRISAKIPNITSKILAKLKWHFSLAEIFTVLGCHKELEMKL
jgi:hypothetical protein